MYIVISILTVLIAILLIAVVLVQKSKGGGLASNFSSSNQVLGVRRTNDFIEKATWTLAGIIAVLAIVSAFVMPNSVTNTGSRVKAPVAAPVIEGTEYSTNPILEVPATEETVEVVETAETTEAPAADKAE